MTAPSPLLAASTERLAAVLYEHRPLTPRQLPPLLVSGCTCGWGNEVYAHTAHLAQALIDSGAVVPAASLADDEALVERVAAECFPDIGQAGPLGVDIVPDVFSALAAALEDR